MELSMTSARRFRSLGIGTRISGFLLTNSVREGSDSVLTKDWHNSRLESAHWSKGVATFTSTIFGDPLSNRELDSV